MRDSLNGLLKGAPQEKTKVSTGLWVLSAGLQPRCLVGKQLVGPVSHVIPRRSSPTFFRSRAGFQASAVEVSARPQGLSVAQAHSHRAVNIAHHSRLPHPGPQHCRSLQVKRRSTGKRVKRCSANPEKAKAKDMIAERTSTLQERQCRRRRTKSRDETQSTTVTRGFSTAAAVIICVR